MEMLSDYGSMHAAVIFDPCGVKQAAISILPTFYGRRTQCPDIQPGPARYPFYTVGITDKNFKLVELKVLVSFLAQMRANLRISFLTSTVLPPYPMTEPVLNTGEALPISINSNGISRKERSLVYRTYGGYLRNTPVQYRSDCHPCPFQPVELSEESCHALQQEPTTSEHEDRCCRTPQCAHEHHAAIPGHH